MNGELPHENPAGYSSIRSGLNSNIGGKEVQNEKILCSVKMSIKKTSPDNVLYLDALDKPSNDFDDMQL